MDDSVDSNNLRRTQKNAVGGAPGDTVMRYYGYAISSFCAISKGLMPMEKRIPAFEARREFGKLLQNVTARGDTYVVERHGEPVAAVVPIEVYEQWQQQRSAFFKRWRQAAETANLTPEEAEALAGEAVQAVRRDQAG